MPMKGAKNMKRITELELNIPTNYCFHLDKLNEITNGVNEGELVIIAARPGCGKTSLMLQLAAHLQIMDKTEFYSLEMTSTELLLRCKKLFRIDKLNNLWISDKSNLKLKEIEKSDAKFIFIDYFDFIDENVKTITKQLKRIAKKNKCVIFLACQLNRTAQEKEPTLAMLRNTGSIEQDADQVWFITKNRIKVAKNRKYKTGDVYIKFNNMYFNEDTKKYWTIRWIKDNYQRILDSDDIEEIEHLKDMINELND